MFLQRVGWGGGGVKGIGGVVRVKLDRIKVYMPEEPKHAQQLQNVKNSISDSAPPRPRSGGGRTRMFSWRLSGGAGWAVKQEDRWRTANRTVGRGKGEIHGSGFGAVASPAHIKPNGSEMIVKNVPKKLIFSPFIRISLSLLLSETAETFTVERHEQSDTETFTLEKLP